MAPYWMRGRGLGWEGGFGCLEWFGFILICIFMNEWMSVWNERIRDLLVTTLILRGDVLANGNLLHWFSSFTLPLPPLNFRPPHFVQLLVKCTNTLYCSRWRTARCLQQIWNNWKFSFSSWWLMLSQPRSFWCIPKCNFSLFVMLLHIFNDFIFMLKTSA